MASGISINIGHNRAEAGAIQINNVTNNIALNAEQLDRDCLRALQCPDPFRVKNQLKASKDVLLREAFEWILHDPNYLRWSHGQDVALLWIKGGAGKGKTMMSIGLVEELSRASDEQDSPVVIYFFCQNADSSLNTLDAIIKGLIHQLVRERPHATQEIRARWDQTTGQFTTSTGRSLLSQEDLWHILLAMLDRCRHDRIFVLVDALDECQDSIAQLLRQIVSTGLDWPSHVKWLLTSRPMDVAEQILLARSNQALVSLEVNLDRLAHSVAAYVSTKVDELTRTWRKCSQDLRLRIEQRLASKAGGTFLWVSLMCKELHRVDVEDALLTIEKTPAGLHAVYERAYKDLRRGHATDVAGCTQLLRVMMLAFRPLNLVEVSNLLNFIMDDQSLEFWIARSASFVQIQMQGEKIPHPVFTHQSARDYLAGLEGSIPSDKLVTIDHTEMSLRCVTFLTHNLTANLLQWPDYSAAREQILRDRARLPIGLGYQAEYWSMHLEIAEVTPSKWAVLNDNGPVEIFLRWRFLEWLEYLSLTDQLKRAREGLDVLLKLKGTRQHQSPSSYSAILLDCCEFLQHHYDTIWKWPLQIYISALIFSPVMSNIRQLNLNRFSKWLRRVPEIVDWSFLGRTNADHPVWSVFFSSGGHSFASVDASLGNTTVKLWDTQTGILQHTHRGHSNPVNTVAFSPDELLAWGSEDGTVRVWEARSGTLRCTLEGHSKNVNVVAFSPDGQLLASGSSDCTVRVWEVDTSRLFHTLECSIEILSATFSPNGQLIALGGRNGIVGIWGTQNGRLHQKFQDYSGNIFVVAFSPNGQLIAAANAIDGSFGDEVTIKVWKVSQPSSIRATFQGALRHFQNRKAVCTIQADDYTTQLHFSRDGSQLITDCGCYSISNAGSFRDPSTTGSKTNELTFKNSWIVCGSKRLLHVPKMCRVLCYDSHDDEIVIGCSNGQVWRFSIDRELALSGLRS